MQIDYVQFHQRQDRTQYLFDKFRPYLQGAVLDVGCDRAYLKSLLPHCRYIGIDLAGTPDVQLNLEQTDRLPFDDDQFDCVVCADVLEHLDNLHCIFAELLRVSRRYLIISLPNNWNAARVPLQRGRGSFAHYGLPPDKPQDRHKWFFSLTDARDFILERLKRHPNMQIIEERICEKPRHPLRRLPRRLRYPAPWRYLNRYAHTLWTVLQKNSLS